MANGKPPRRQRSARPGDTGRMTSAREFDADARTAERQNTPVKIGGLTFTRRKKDWDVSRAMRAVTRAQEKNLALGQRLRARLAELEVEQIEKAADGDEAAEAALETQIEAIIAKADESTEAAELVSYRLLALLLVPPAIPSAEERAKLDDEDPLVIVNEEFVGAFGPVDEDADETAVTEAAIEFLQDELDVEDAARMAEELTGSTDPDPPEVPTTENGGS